jgi:hypothetical protein
MKKRREYQSSDLVKFFAKKYGFEEKLKAFEVKDFLEDYLDESFFNEIEQVDLSDKILTIRIKSPLFKNDFRLRKSFFLKKFNEYFGENSFDDLVIR